MRWYGHENRSLKESKRRTKIVGCCSINDIISDKKGLSRREKIDFIRHRYSYYDGNYDVFFDEENKPLQLREQLNLIIEGIVDKKILPEVLSHFNKYIQFLRKSKTEKENVLATQAVTAFTTEQRKQMTITAFKNRCNYKIREEKKPVIISNKWREKAEKKNATAEEIAMVEFYLDRHTILPFIIQNIGWVNLISTVSLWLFKNKTYAQKFPEFYKKYEYMFESYANDNDTDVETDNRCIKN